MFSELAGSTQKSASEELMDSGTIEKNGTKTRKSSRIAHVTIGPHILRMHSESSQWVTNAAQNVRAHRNALPLMNTTIYPYDNAAKVYDREPCARTFEEDLDSHLRRGFVFSTPASFIMGRPVDRYANECLILDPDHSFYSWNSWLIFLASGDLRQFFRNVPFSLEWVGWQRSNKLRWYKLEDIKRKILCSQ